MGNISTSKYDKNTDQFILNFDNSEDYLKFQISDSLLKKVYNMKLNKKDENVANNPLNINKEHILSKKPNENIIINSKLLNNITPPEPEEEEKENTIELENRIFDRVKNLESRLNNITESYLNHNLNLSLKSQKEISICKEKNIEFTKTKKMSQISNISDNNSIKHNDEDYTNEKGNKSVDFKLKKIKINL